MCGLILHAKRLGDLDFYCRLRILIGYSSQSQEADRLERNPTEKRAEKGREAPGVIAKIETARAVRNLPELIVHGANRLPFGVMIARSIWRSKSAICALRKSKKRCLT
jgi:pyruvate kinase